MSLLHGIRKSVHKNKAGWYLGISIASGIAAIISSIKGTQLAIEKIRHAEHDKDDTLTKGELIKTVLPCYIPTIAFEALSIVCTTRLHKTHTMKYAALAAALAVREADFKEYKEIVKEKLGKSKEKEVVDAIAQKRLDEVQQPMTVTNVYNGPQGQCLVYDTITKNAFYMDWEGVKQRINHLNALLNERDCVSKNDWCEEFGQPYFDPVHGDEDGDDAGWSLIQTGLIDLMGWDYPPLGTTRDGRPCFVIQVNNPPTRTYQDVY